tara:strand:+ start:196 stop:390 length:195 start_codon:yes stop_codon:yes gene_type:complete
MSKFTLICEDEAIPFRGASKIKHEFETEELFTILLNMTQFLRGCSYIAGDDIVTLGKEVNLSDE